ncbi:hypothetical protein [Paraliomyxa miuraensis]|uniref:hypothetical protein n=1 Tax=Paraliomyxa miuraensis TaxID=376150 RepID=UPI0022535D96|nr:hypothetical protein [Paraliomyxa miuraensis]MCX4240228.1 hypothetical protein [Paraliomyxa miuraensis]
MMTHRRSRSLRLAWLTLLVLGALSSVASAASPQAPTRKERIEELWLDAAGDSGFVRTVPLYLDDAPAHLHFGPAFCGRSHRLGETTLRALQAALASGQPVRIDAETFGAGEAQRRCVTGVALFAP